jgi:thiamine-phosphate pyrophosphorylase
MLVTDDRLLEGRDLVSVVRAAERGGVTSVQLRLKDATARELAHLVRELLRAVRIPVLVNDRLDVAIATGAAGVHLGPDDVPIGLARRIAPPGFVVGASVGSDSEAALAGEADYWGIGPWRATGTKKDAGTELGAAGFRRLSRLAGGRPVLAIGGVTPDDVPAILQAGATGLAVVSGILSEEDVAAAARLYAGQWGGYPSTR